MVAQVGSAFCGEVLDIAIEASVIIRPDPRKEVFIHDLSYTDAVEIYRYHTRNVLLGFDDGPGSWSNGLGIPLTNNYYLVIKNVSDQPIDVVWGGIYTK